MVSETTPMVLAEGHTRRWLWTSLPCWSREALKVADVDDRIRSAAATIYQALIEAELSSVIGALPHERTETRTGMRNGHQPKTISITASTAWSALQGRARTTAASTRSGRAGQVPQESLGTACATGPQRRTKLV
jgi:hypothetical protein